MAPAAPIYSTIDDEKITNPSLRPKQQRLSVIPSNKFSLEKLLWVRNIQCFSYACFLN